MTNFVDKNLTTHFKLSELTITSVAKFQDDNRLLNSEQVQKLTAVADLLEWAREFLMAPISVHSGYRCPDLNEYIGSSKNSQHLWCEAADFTPVHMDLGNAFRLIWTEVASGRRDVGQLIYETAQRPYGVESWIHISVGEPYRKPDKCNQVLRMNDGKYQLLFQRPQKEIPS